MSEERNKEELDIERTEENRRRKLERELEKKEKEERESEKKRKDQKPWIEKIYYGLAVIAGIGILLLIVGVLDEKTRITEGIGIIILALMTLAIAHGIVIVKRPYRYVIEFLGELYEVWGPRYLPHLLIPGLMRIKEKIPYMSTVLIINYMDERDHTKENGETKKDHLLDFTDDSTGITIKSTVRVFDTIKATYKVTTEGGWKALVQEIVDANTRALAGQTELDAALAGRTELGKKLSEEEMIAIKKDYIKSTFSREVEKLADAALCPYGIDYQTVLMTDIILNDETVTARRAIQVAKKSVETEEFNLQAAEKRGTGKGLEESRAITEFIRVVREGTKEKIELTPEQVMTYIISKTIPEAFTKGNATLISTRGGAEELLADATAIAGTVMERLKKKGSE